MTPEILSLLKSLVPTNACHNCSSWVRNGLIFCDDMCKNDWIEDRSETQFNESNMEQS